MNPNARSAVDMQYAIAAGQVINHGDHLWFDPTVPGLKSIGGEAGNLVRTYATESRAVRDAVARYAGVAEFLNLTTDFARNAVKVANGTVRELTVSSATYKRGDLLGPFKDSGGNYLNRNTLAKKNDPRDAVAMVMEDYSSATTTVLAQVFSSQMRAELLSRIKIWPFAFDNTMYAAGGTLVNDFTFGMPIRLFNMTAVVTILTATAGSVTLSNGGNALDDVMTIGDAQAVGTVISQDIDDATDYDWFDHDDALDIALAAAPTAGAINLFLYGLLQAPQV